MGSQRRKLSGMIAIAHAAAKLTEFLDGSAPVSTTAPGWQGRRCTRAIFSVTIIYSLLYINNLKRLYCVL
jgi:hypothetical protein